MAWHEPFPWEDRYTMADNTEALTVTIKGPLGDYVHIDPAHFAGSHYEAQGYVQEPIPDQPDFYTANGLDAGPEQTSEVKAAAEADAAAWREEHPYGANAELAAAEVARVLQTATAADTPEALMAAIKAAIDEHFTASAPSSIATETTPG